VTEIRVRQGRTLIMIRDNIAREIEADIRQSLGAEVTDYMEALVDGIIDKARAVWPIKTGESRDSLHRILTVNPAKLSITAGVASGVDYIRYIKSSRQGKSRDRSGRLVAPWFAYINTPTKAARKDLKRAMPVLLAAAISRRLGR
jgi:hypothetical protein